MNEILSFLERIFFTNLFGQINLYMVLYSVFKFLFVLIVLVFIGRIVKMITMDLRSTVQKIPSQAAYLKLLNNPRSFDFPIRDEYFLADNTTIGRADDNHIVLKDRRMSKHQARIFQDGTHYMIDDLGATNPTMVNNDIVEQPQELFPRDIVTMGGISFVFLEGGDDEK